MIRITALVLPLHELEEDVIHWSWVVLAGLFVGLLQRGRARSTGQVAATPICLGRVNMTGSKG